MEDTCIRAPQLLFGESEGEGVLYKEAGSRSVCERVADSATITLDSNPSELR